MQADKEWQHCGLQESEFKLIRLPRGKEDSHTEFSIKDKMYAMRKSPRKTKEQHEEECRKMAKASLAKKEAEALSFQEPDYSLDE